MTKNLTNIIGNDSSLFIKSLRVIDSCNNLQQSKVCYNYLDRVYRHVEYSAYLILYEQYRKKVQALEAQLDEQVVSTHSVGGSNPS